MLGPEEVEECIFSFGVVADIQYADKDNGSYEGRFQRYREAPGKLAHAVACFNKAIDQLKFVLTLGDIIDGNISEEISQQDFETVLAEFAKLEVNPVHHLLGNHCLALPRTTLVKELGMPFRYYCAPICLNWKLIVLDSMDMSVRWPEGSVNRKEAEEFVEKHPLGEDNPQMSEWNGGIGSTQMAWLRETVANCESAKEKVFVALHHPLVEGSAPPTHLLWNHSKVTDFLVASKSVLVVFSGHYHVGGYKKVGTTHFVVQESILEAPTNSVAHAVVDVFATHLQIVGSGIVTSRHLPIL